MGGGAAEFRRPTCSPADVGHLKGSSAAIGTIHGEIVVPATPPCEVRRLACRGRVLQGGASCLQPLPVGGAICVLGASYREGLQLTEVLGRNNPRH